MSNRHLLMTHEGASDGLRMVVTAHPVVNLALIHNNVPIIQQIVLTNTGDAALTDVHVTARINGLLDGEAPEWSTVVSTIGAGESVGRELIPSRSHVKSLGEAYDAELVVTTSTEGADVSVTAPLTLLAANEWFAAPFCFESLASFVEPNTPAVTSILSDASDILAAKTGSSSLEGYQSGPNRAGLIAAALYAALVRRDIRYIDPPASFEFTGQKIRSPQEVIDTRFGTCLDLSVTYASCLEAAGLHPLVWVIDGHAFVGFLREDNTLSTPLVLEPNAMANLAESGRAVILEAAFYGGSAAPSFRSASDAANRHLRDLSRMLFVLDVSAARRAGVKPFPSAAAIAAEEVRPPAASVAADLSLPDVLTTVRDSDQVLDTTDHSPARVKKWKSALLDLSTRNRLLNLRSSAEVVYLPIPPDSLATADDLIHAGTKLKLRPVDDISGLQFLAGTRSARDLPPNALHELLVKEHEILAEVTEGKYASSFKRLQRTARTMLEETGSTNLYMTFGSLVHRTVSGNEARAPLFLLPVQIVGGRGNSRFEVIADTTGVAAPNHCLIEWLRVAHSVSIPALNSPPLDDSGIDITAAFKDIRAALIENRLDFRIDETATISICKFGTLGLWQDLQNSWDELAKSPLVHHLAHTPGARFVDPGADPDILVESLRVDETDHPLPVPYDGSQLKAIEASAQGRTFVLEGPPGTGKSQTITNLIARNLAAGRTVLFVAEKQAALEVVRRRLEAVGLDPYTLNLHGASQKSSSIRKQIKRSLEFTAEYNSRIWETELSTWRSRHRRLESYPDAIHGKNSVGDSLWGAADFVTVRPDDEYFEIPTSFVASAGPNDVAAVRDALVEFTRTVVPDDLTGLSHWSIAGTISDESALTAAVARLASAQQQLGGDAVAAQIATTLDDPAAITTLVGQARAELAATPITDADLARFGDAGWAQQFAAAVVQFDDFVKRSAMLTQHFHRPFLDSGDHAGIIAAIRESTSGLFGKKKRVEEAQIKLREAVHPGVDLPLDQALELLTYVPSVRTERGGITDLFAGLLGTQTPVGWDPLDPHARQRLQDVHARIRATGTFASTNPRVWSVLSTHRPLTSATLAVLDETVAAWTGWTAAVGATPETVADWRDGRTWMSAWQASQAQWSADVAASGATRPRRAALLESILAPVRANGLSALADGLLSGDLPSDDADSRFDAGVARASITERLHAGRLDDFAATVQNGHVEDFADAADQLRRRMTSDLPALLAAQRPFDSQRLTGSYGHLRRALEGTRNAMSVRSLVREYGREIQAAAPCFLVNPASLAQYVAPGSITFDLVVFDEASQVTVAQAIGALGRARSAVIVGDSKQMPPTAIGVASAADALDGDSGEEDAEVVPDDLDSILTEAVESGVDRLWLTWHYRSKDESLIAFSNEKYYDDQLSSLPNSGAGTDSGVEVRRVNGHFNREDKKTDFRTNRVEAEGIVAEITRLVARGERSIGVVTFNRQQQDLILNLLEASRDPVIHELLLPDAVDGIFVKNLENVQGDERDIILFSTAFSKPVGKDTLPLNFGPLSRAGGEKRLNVAVTRAKKRVVMFTSFDPSDIELSRTSSVGLAHLRGYMEAALSRTSTRHAKRNRPVTAIENEIAEALRAAGFEVQQAYGMSEFVVDIAVKSPESEAWQVAVMLDGPRWRHRPTVTDRDVMPELLETLMDWDQVVHVWLPGWLKDRDAVVARVREAVEAAEVERLMAVADVPAEDVIEAPAEEPVVREVAEPTSEPTTLISDIARDAPAAPTVTNDQPMRVASVATDLPPMEVVTPTQPSPRFEAPTPCEFRYIDDTPLGVKEDLDDLSSPQLRQTVQAAIAETVAVEGPIQLDQLCSRIVRRFGFGRAAAARTAFVRGLIPPHQIREDELGAFVWPDDKDPETWSQFRVPVDEKSKRSNVDQIPPEEITNALVFAANNGAGDFDSVVRAAFKQFDISRMTGGVRDRSRRCLDQAVEARRVSFDGETYASAIAQ